MADETRASELQSQLRDLALPLEKAHHLAVDCAVRTVREMREAFNKFAGEDPYETGRAPEAWDLSIRLDESDPAVRTMAATFMLMLSSRGLLKIDPVRNS